MSIIIHDVPPVVDRATVEQLRSYFCCESIVIADEFDPFPLSRKQVDEFVDGTILFLTNIDPVAKDYTLRHNYKQRVFPYHLAVAATGVPDHAN